MEDNRSGNNKHEPLEIIFCDIYKKFIDACDKYIKENPELQEHFKFATYFGDIRDLKVKSITAYISPANCFGSMGGGIDLIYSRDMFPSVNKIVMDKISKLETQGVLRRSFDRLGKGTKRAILPIGQAMITPLNDYEKYQTCYLITAPTMEYPMNIQNTNNPYRAFLATLNIIKENKDLNIQTLVCPGLGTGVGNVSPDESVRQIFEALNEFSLLNF